MPDPGRALCAVTVAEGIGSFLFDSQWGFPEWVAVAGLGVRDDTDGTVSRPGAIPRSVGHVSMIRLQWGAANGPGLVDEANPSFMVADATAVAFARSHAGHAEDTAETSPLRWLAGTVSAAVCLGECAGQAMVVAAGGPTDVLVWRDNTLIRVGDNRAPETAIERAGGDVATMGVMAGDRVLLCTTDLIDVMSTVGLARLMALMTDPVLCARAIISRARHRAGGRGVPAVIVVDLIDHGLGGIA